MKWIGRQLLWCGLAAGIVPLLVFIFSRGRASASTLWWAFGSALIYSCMIALPLEYTLHRVKPKLRGQPRWISTPAYVSIIVSVAVLGTLAGSAVICGVGLLPWSRYWAMFRDAVQVSLFITGLFSIGGFASSTMEERLNESNERLRQKEEDERRARAMATEARLASLESRVHPHFLFNAINSILALIREDPRRAEDLLERMAALLRFSLDASQGRLVPLEHELTIVRDYLEIERARFGNRLRYEVTSDERIEAEVPPLSIQTLVENSVKYAVSPRREGGRITVRATAEAAGIRIEVEDDGPGFSEESIGTGHGLALLRERLTGIGELEIRRDSGVMTVCVRIPQAVRA